ncbi:hypothetical protein QTI24_29550 [Variovorax sp. J22P240]|uniref:hypothetical protein n=1 Tax=Variovorax sp. J22P240 TaxID=3053514 RepID=UPI002577CEE0|nr:hypothetical protein [Variovorax sp. J22P240]MDM0002773.1 hypothetical protein [Variovorax sp. J22P240]
MFLEHGLSRGYWGLPLQALWLLATINAGAAQPYVTAKELLDSGAPRLSATEMRELIAPGSVTEYMSPSRIGWKLSWNNGPDGRHIIANHDLENRWTYMGSGTWRIRSDGAYCLVIKWHSLDDRWCRFVHRYDNALYLARPDLEKAPDGRQGRIVSSPGQKRH